MTLFEVGRLCLKIAGRDAGNKCVVIEQFDKNYVLIDGATRRKKVNIRHLEPLAEIISLKSGSYDEIKKVFEKLGIKAWDHKSKEAVVKPTRLRKALIAFNSKEKPAKENKKLSSKKKEE